MTATMDENRVTIFDTTLRDGEQSPGASMDMAEKLKIALLLEEMGVDVIEAGFPIASAGDFEAVNQIASTLKNISVCALSRADRGDIECCAAAIAPAPRRRIHTFISTSALHMKYKLRMTPEQVHERVGESVRYARTFTDDVEWSAEDGSRTEYDFLCRCVEAAIRAGARTINIPDTVGYAIPDEFSSCIKMLLNRVPNIDRAILSVHCHNDLGLAVANALAAVQAGARQVECTLNGLGERAGNAALEEIVMALRTRYDHLPFTTGIKTELITRASKLVSAITGFVVQPNKAIVGANAFAHEAGIHQDGLLKHAATYEIMPPESVGLSQAKIVLGKHSGRRAFREKVRTLLGYELSEQALEEAFRRFKDLADRKKEIFEEDLTALVGDELAQGLQGEDRIRFGALEVMCGSRHPSADLELVIDGVMQCVSATGNGPIDAIFIAIRALFPHAARLQLYQVHAVTQGTDAQAEVTVRLEENGRSVNGYGADTDTLVASARAYVNALNRLLVKREKTAPTALSA